MKKKFLSILEKYNLTLIKFEHFKNQFDYNNYDIEFEDSEGNNYFWDGHTDIWDKDDNSLTNKDGILIWFEKWLRNKLK